jgi:hypothetical protein
MATCAACNLTILFGGYRTNGFRFCSKSCAKNSPWLARVRAVPQEWVATETDLVFRGGCPVCGGPGPVDVRPAYRVMSFVVITIRKNTAIIACAKCGRKEQLSGILHCFLLGWWGLPAGLIFTPIMIGANVVAITKNKRTIPSKALNQQVRLRLATKTPDETSYSPYIRNSESM